MGWLLFIGVLLIAFGPLATFWWTTILNRPQLIIIAFSSAFFWLMGLLTLSLFWLIPGVKVGRRRHLSVCGCCAASGS